MKKRENKRRGRRRRKRRRRRRTGEEEKRRNLQEIKQPHLEGWGNKGNVEAFLKTHIFIKWRI